MAWTTPKTDWKNGDYFNIGDYNRILNNELFVWDLYYKFGYTLSPTPLYPIGSPILSYSVARWDSDSLVYMGVNCAPMLNDTGIGGYERIYWDDNTVISADKLNTLETWLLELYEFFQSRMEGLRKIPFKLGQYKTRI